MSTLPKPQSQNLNDPRYSGMGYVGRKKNMSTLDDLLKRLREIPLDDRLKKSRRMIGKMCSEGRPPKMTIPVHWDDEDFFISNTIKDALEIIAPS